MMTRRALLLVAWIAAFFPSLAGAGADMAARWPPPSVAYREVRAYYDPRGYNGLDLMKSGSLRYDKGIPLTRKQVERLLAAVQGKHPAYTAPMCIEIHHAFVFYDPLQKPVALIEPCFECLVFLAHPGGLGPWVDFPALADLVHEIGLPLSPRGMSPAAFRKSFAANVEKTEPK
jgi:hypothetical protein